MSTEEQVQNSGNDQSKNDSSPSLKLSWKTILNKVKETRSSAILLAILTLFIFTFIFAYPLSTYKIPINNSDLPKTATEIYAKSDTVPIIYLNKATIDLAVTKILKAKYVRPYLRTIIDSLNQMIKGKTLIIPNGVKNDSSSIVSSSNLAIIDSLDSLNSKKIANLTWKYKNEGNNYRNTWQERLNEDENYKVYRARKNGLEKLKAMPVATVIPVCQKKYKTLDTVISYQSGMIINPKLYMVKTVLHSTGDFYPVISNSVFKVKSINKKDKSSYKSVYNQILPRAKVIVRENRKKYRRSFYRSWFSRYFSILGSIFAIILLGRYRKILNREEVVKKSTHNIYFGINTTSTVFRWIAIITVFLGQIFLGIAIVSTIMGDNIMGNFILNFAQIKFLPIILITIFLQPLLIGLIFIIESWVFLLISELLCFISSLYHITFLSSHLEEKK